MSFLKRSPWPAAVLIPWLSGLPGTPVDTGAAASVPASPATTASVATVAASAATAPPLPPPTGQIVRVSTEPELQQAVRRVAAGTTILIAPGTYRLTRTLYVRTDDVVLRGETDGRDDVVLAGGGMIGAAPGGVRYGIWTNAKRVTIANLTIRDVFDHAIILNAGAQAPRIYNVHLLDSGSQFIKSNPDAARRGVDNGRVEFALIEYSTTARNDYTNGVDVHAGRDWVIRDSFFRNIRAPRGALAGPAVLMWRGSAGTIVEGNTFVNCQREISFGLRRKVLQEHAGGIIRNNFIYREPGTAGDAAIYLGDAPGAQVLHNTILVSGTYRSPIEYRFRTTTGVVIRNNLLDGRIAPRNGAMGDVGDNYTAAAPALFVDAGAGDLHLRPDAAAVIDRFPSLPAVSGDWDGQRRPQGAAADAGADEQR